MKILYQDEYIELRESEIDNCIEYIRKKITNNVNTNKEIINKLSSQIKEKNFLKVICDVSRLDFMKEGTKKYVKNFCLPFLGYVGANFFAVVTGKDVEKKLYYQKLAEEFSEIIDEWHIKYEFFYDIDEARKWMIYK